jgi:hypothetical protein
MTPSGHLRCGTAALALTGLLPEAKRNPARATTRQGRKDPFGLAQRPATEARSQGYVVRIGQGGSRVSERFGFFYFMRREPERVQSVAPAIRPIGGNWPSSAMKEAHSMTAAAG